MSNLDPKKCYIYLTCLIASFHFKRKSTMIVNESIAIFNKHNLIMFRMEFHFGETVYLTFDKEIVGISCICKIDPNSTCSATKIRQGNVSLLVEECLKDVVLPFPTMDSLYLEISL